GGQGQLRPLPLAGGQRRRAAGAAAQLPAVAGLELDVVDRHAQGHLAQRHGVPDARLDVLAGDDAVARLQPLRRQDVRLLAVLVAQQRDAGRAVRVVLDGDHRRPDAVLLALEVDDAVHPLGASPAEARGHDALVAAPALLLHRPQQRLLRPLARGDDVADLQLGAEVDLAGDAGGVAHHRVGLGALALDDLLDRPLHHRQLGEVADAAAAAPRAGR